MQESCSYWLFPGFLPPSSSHGAHRRQLQRSQWVMLQSKCTLSKTQGIGGIWPWRSVRERPLCDSTVASLCRPLPQQQELTPKGFSTVETVGGNKISAEDVLNKKQSTMTAEWHLWTRSFKTHFPKKSTPLMASFLMSIRWIQMTKVCRTMKLCSTHLSIKEGTRPHRNGSDAALSFAFEGNTVHTLSGNEHTQNNWH